jgi:hypothetical protein
MGRMREMGEKTNLDLISLSPTSPFPLKEVELCFDECGA